MDREREIDRLVSANREWARQCQSLERETKALREEVKALQNKIEYQGLVRRNLGIAVACISKAARRLGMPDSEYLDQESLINDFELIFNSHMNMINQVYEAALELEKRL